MAQLGVLRARPHQRCKPPISHGVSLKRGPPPSAEPCPTGLGREGVLVGRGGLAAGRWQGHRGGSTRRGLKGCMRAMVRKGTIQHLYKYVAKSPRSPSLLEAPSAKAGHCPAKQKRPFLTKYCCGTAHSACPAVPTRSGR